MDRHNEGESKHGGGSEPLPLFAAPFAGKGLAARYLMNPATATLHLDKALTPEGWRRDVRVTLEFGVISALEIGAAAREGDERHALGVPGIANVHSHAFQRAMSGLAERRGPATTIFGAGARRCIVSP